MGALIIFGREIKLCARIVLTTELMLEGTTTTAATGLAIKQKSGMQ